MTERSSLTNQTQAISNDVKQNELLRFRNLIIHLFVISFSRVLEICLSDENKRCAVITALRANMK